MGTIRHAKTSTIPNNPGLTAEIGGGDWNEEHNFELGIEDIDGLEARLVPTEQVLIYRDQALAAAVSASESAVEAAAELGLAVKTADLAASTGATLVGVASGDTLQEALDDRPNSAELAAYLASTNTVALAGHSAAHTQSILDGSLRLETYAALRAYAGRATAVYVSGVLATTLPQSFAGLFQRDSVDVASADNNCTVIVDALGRRWKRQYTTFVSVGWVVGGTDAARINTAIAVAAAAGINLVTLPKQVYALGLTDSIQVPPHMTLRGDAPGPFDQFGASPTVSVIAATLSITSTTLSPIVLQGNDCKIEDLLFYYPNQVAPTAATPTAYPYTITTAIGSGGVRVSRCTAVNAYNFLLMRAGRSKVEDCLIGAFQNGIEIDEVLDWVELSNVKNQCMWDAFAGLTFPQNIDAWVMSNSVALRTKRVDSLVVNNFSVFGRFIGHLFEDSANVALVPRNGYGRFSNVDFDYVAYGVYGVSSNPTAIGFQYTNVTVGANASGVGTPGQAAFHTVAGGTGDPTITVSGGAMRGTWAVGLTGCTVPPPAGRIYIDNMRGLNPMTAAKTPTPAVPASNGVVTNNYPSPVRIAIVGGTISNILINGSGAGTAPGMYILYPGETIAITYTVAPTWAWHGM